MDRFELARHFTYIAHKDELFKMTDPIELKQAAIELLTINYRMRKCLDVLVKDEIPESFIPKI